MKKLKGTPKQVAWAEKIREEKISKAGLYNFNNSHRLQKLLSLACASRATFWIDIRNVFPLDFIDFIDEFDERCDELIFQKIWKLSKADIKKPEKKKLSNMGKRINKIFGNAHLNVGISNRDFISRINYSNSNFFTKLSSNLNESDTIYLKLFSNQKLGNKDIFVIRVYDDLNNHPFLTQSFFIQKADSRAYLDYEVQLGLLRDTKKELLDANPKLKDGNRSNNIQVGGLKLAKELDTLNEKIAETKKAYLCALPLDQDQEINLILKVIEEEYKRNVELIEEDGLIKLYKISIN